MAPRGPLPLAGMTEGLGLAPCWMVVAGSVGGGRTSWAGAPGRGRFPNHAPGDVTGFGQTWWGAAVPLLPAKLCVWIPFHSGRKKDTKAPAMKEGWTGLGKACPLTPTPLSTGRSVPPTVRAAVKVTLFIWQLKQRGTHMWAHSLRSSCRGNVLRENLHLPHPRPP